MIRFFVLAEEPILDFFIGSFCLAMLCVVAGELTLSVAVRFNRKHIDDLKKEIDQKEKLSLQAQQLGDRASYKALNKAANDAWGRHFFTMVAYSAGILWPIPFALAWMQTRFQGIDFPVASRSPGSQADSWPILLFSSPFTSLPESFSNT